MDRLYLKDPGGLLTPDAVRELAPHFLAAAGGRPSSCTATARSAWRRSSTSRACEPGFEVVHTAVGPLSRGTSQPEVVEHRAQPRGRRLLAPRSTSTPQAIVAEHFAQLARAKGLPAGAPREFDAAYYRHQLPGGMVTTTRRMLEELRRPELFDAVLEEVTRVRARDGLSDPGHAGLAVRRQPGGAQRDRRRALGATSPTRPCATSSATTASRRRRSTPRSPTACSSRPQVREAARPASRSRLDGARERFGPRISDEELLLRLTMPAEQVDAMVAARGRPAGGGRPAGARAAGDAAAGARAPAGDLRSSRWTRTARSVVWRRA